MAPLRQLAARLYRIHPPEEVIVLLSAVAVGMGTGLGAVLFIRLMAVIDHGVHTLAQMAQAEVGPPGGWLLRIAVMAVAGLIVGVVVERWAREAKGHGVPEVMEAMVVTGGRIRARVAALKLLCSAVTIGVGGSAGREGPIVQVGAALGSILGQVSRVGVHRMRTLVACGAAGGIAATFNAPIAGAIFALEIVLGSFTVRYFGAVVISSVSASIVARAFLSARPAFTVPAYAIHRVAEFPLYGLLGLLAGVVAAAFIWLLYAVEARVDGWRVWPPLRYVVGMILAGGVGMLLPGQGVLGPGLHRIGEIVASDFHMPLAIMAALLLLKLIATSLTLGSGNSGGVFAPSLFMGATLGGMVGTVAHLVWPAVVVNPGAYVIAGMAAVFAGAARAPITAILIVFEMSGDYALILPLLVATALATVVAQALSPESIYTMKLARRGIRLSAGRVVDLLAGVSVAEVMDEEVHAVDREMDLATLSDLFAQSGHHCVAVLDDGGHAWGMVRREDLDQAIHRNLPMTTPAGEIATPLARLVVIHPDESGADALSRMGVRGLESLPVVSRSQPLEFLGLVRRNDLLDAYTVVVSRRGALHHQVRHALGPQPAGTEFVDIDLKVGDAGVGKRVGELAARLPREAILIAVRRNGRTLVPHGGTRLEVGDRVTAFARSDDATALLRALQGGSESQEGEGSGGREGAG